MVLALNNLQSLICHKTQTTKQPVRFTGDGRWPPYYAYGTYNSYVCINVICEQASYCLNKVILPEPFL